MTCAVYSKSGRAAPNPSLANCKPAFAAGLAVRFDPRGGRVREVETQLGPRPPAQPELAVHPEAVGLEVEPRLDPAQNRLRLEDVGSLELVFVVEEADVRTERKFGIHLPTHPRRRAEKQDFGLVGVEPVARRAVRAAGGVLVVPARLHRYVGVETDGQAHGSERQGGRKFADGPGGVTGGVGVGAVVESAVLERGVGVELEGPVVDFAKRGGIVKERAERIVGRRGTRAP